MIGEDVSITFSTNNIDTFYTSIWEGPITDDEIYEAYSNFINSDKWSKDLNEFSDISKADFSKVTTEGLIRLGELEMNHLIKHGVKYRKTAIYSPHDFPFGMARLYEGKMFKSPEQVYVFRGIKEALDWLTE